MLTFRPITSAAVQPNCRSAAAAEGLHDPALVDDDHGVGHGVQDRLQVGLARGQVGDGGGRVARALRRMRRPASPTADADQDEQRRAEQSSADRPPSRPPRSRREDQAERRRRRAGPRPPTAAAASSAGTNSRKLSRPGVPGRAPAATAMQAARRRDRDRVAGDPAVRAGRAERWARAMGPAVGPKRVCDGPVHRPGAGRRARLVATAPLRWWGRRRRAAWRPRPASASGGRREQGRRGEARQGGRQQPAPGPERPQVEGRGELEAAVHHQGRGQQQGGGQGAGGRIEREVGPEARPRPAQPRRPASRSPPVEASPARRPSIRAPASHRSQPAAAPTRSVVSAGKAMAASASTIMAAPPARAGRRRSGCRWTRARSSTASWRGHAAPPSAGSEPARSPSRSST